MDAVDGMGRVRQISVIAPMRDEADHVSSFARDLAAQDFDGPVEVLVADGGSRDGSVRLLRDAAGGKQIDLEILENPAGWVSHGLNACIARARGDLIVRMDLHSRYPPDYLRRLAELAAATGAWNVGGYVFPAGRTAAERAVACAMDSPFGGIGWTRASANDGPVEVDTVTFGAFRPEAFARAGLYDEDFLRNQDDELNLRVRLAGGKIVMDPSLRVEYNPRGALGAVWRQYYEYGIWKVPVMRKHKLVLSARSLAPAGFVGSLALLAVVAPRWELARRLLALEIAAYASGAVVFGLRGIRARREPIALLPRVVATFPAFHLGYGVGMLRGLLRALFSRAA